MNYFEWNSKKTQRPGEMRKSSATARGKGDIKDMSWNAPRERKSEETMKVEETTATTSVIKRLRLRRFWTDKNS